MWIPHVASCTDQPSEELMASSLQPDDTRLFCIYMLGLLNVLA